MVTITSEKVTLGGYDSDDCLSYIKETNQTTISKTSSWVEKTEVEEMLNKDVIRKRKLDSIFKLAENPPPPPELEQTISPPTNFITQLINKLTPQQTTGTPENNDNPEPTIKRRVLKGRTSKRREVDVKTETLIEPNYNSNPNRIYKRKPNKSKVRSDYKDRNRKTIRKLTKKSLFTGVNICRRYREYKQEIIDTVSKTDNSEELLKQLDDIFKKNLKDVKKYECVMCGSRFNRNTHYNDHVNCHNNIRNYKCEICDITFIQKANLNNHYGRCIKINNMDKDTLLERDGITEDSNIIKYLTREYECKGCLVKFKSKSFYNKHIELGSSKCYMSGEV